MPRHKILLSLTNEAMQVLNESATERKRGELVSALLLHYDGEIAKPQPEAGILERIEQQLIRIEALLQAMTGNTQD